MAGTAMLPVPRMTFARELNTQMRTAPAKTTWEWVSAAARDAPRPPIAP